MVVEIWKAKNHIRTEVVNPVGNAVQEEVVERYRLTGTEVEVLAVVVVDNVLVRWKMLEGWGGGRVIAGR